MSVFTSVHAFFFAVVNRTNSSFSASQSSYHNLSKSAVSQLLITVQKSITLLTLFLAFYSNCLKHSAALSKYAKGDGCYISFHFQFLLSNEMLNLCPSSTLDSLM